MRTQPTGATVTDSSDERVRHRQLSPLARWTPITVAATDVEQPRALSILARAAGVEARR